MREKKFSISKRLKSFGYAFQGLRTLLKKEHNAWIHLFAAIAVLIAGYAFDISGLEWIAVVFCIAFVFSMELINTAIEDISDFVSPGKHEKIKIIKDLSAAAVLVAAIASVIVGLIIFLPKITG